MYREYKTAIAGSRFYPVEVVPPLGATLRLVRDSTNAFDRNAIRVEYDSATLGFIPKTLSQVLAANLDAGASSLCYVCENSLSGLYINFVVFDPDQGGDRHFELKRQVITLSSRMEKVVRAKADAGSIHPENVSAPKPEYAPLQFFLGKYLLEQSDRYWLGIHYCGYAALNGHSEARQLIADLYETDEHEEHTYTFAQAGHPEAQYKVGLKYFLRRRDPQPRRALKYWKWAAAQGHLNAQKRLAFVYETGDGVPKESEAAAYWRRVISNPRPKHSTTATIKNTVA